MKGLKLDGFKKVQDNDHYTVFQHGEGHKITVAKAALSEKTRAQLNALPIHAFGGVEVPASLSPNINQSPSESDAAANDIVGSSMQQSFTPTPQEQFQINFNKEVERRMIDPAALDRNPGAKKDLESQVIRQMGSQKMMASDAASEQQAKFDQSNKDRVAAGLEPVAGMQPQAQPGYQVPQMQMPGQAQHPDMFAGANNDMFQRGVKEGESAIGQQQRIESDIGKQNAALISQNVDEKQQAKNDFDDRMKLLVANHDAFVKDYQDHPIVADHLMKNMGGPQRVMTAIGLILGGMGGGLTGQKNPALEFLQQKIEQDIQAQMKSQDNRRTLIGANHEAMGDLRTAYHASVASMNDFLASKIQEAAANSSDPMAKQRATAAMAQLHMSNADHLRSIEMQQGLMAQMGAAQKSGQQVDPALRIRAFVPNPAEQDKYFKELKEAEEAVNARDNVLYAIDKVAKLNTVGNRVLNPFQTKAQIAAIKGPVVAALSKATAGRFTEQDAGMLDPIFKEVFDNPGTVAQKRQQVLKLVSEKMHFPMLRNLGIDVNSMGKYSGQQGQSRIPEAPPMLRK